MTTIDQDTATRSQSPELGKSKREPNNVSFPTQCSHEATVARRGLLKWFSLASVAMALPAFTRGEGRANGSSEPPRSFRVGRSSALGVGESLVARDPQSDAPVLVFRDTAGEIRAYDQRCTHLMCPVSFDGESGRIICPCHRGFFSASDGAPVGGPARTRLRQYAVAVRDDGGIWLTLEAAEGNAPQGEHA